MAGRSIGFIGGGRVVSILLGGWRRAEAMPRKVTVFVCSDEALAGLQAKAPEVQTTNDMTAAASPPCRPLTRWSGAPWRR